MRREKIYYQCPHCFRAAFYLKNMPMLSRKVLDKISYFNHGTKSVAGMPMICQACKDPLLSKDGDLPMSRLRSIEVEEDD